MSTPGGAEDARSASLRVATLNLFHFADPGVGWISPHAFHTPESLLAKEEWLMGYLAEIDADIIGFQEVVAVERLKALCARAGYPHFAMVAEPIIQEPRAPGERQIYRRAQQAVVSRWPMQAAAVEPRDALDRCLSLNSHWEFRRPPVRAHVQTPLFGEIVLYSAHLKSPGAGPHDAPIHDPASEPGRDPMESISRARAKQAIQRIAEASALYHDVTARIAEAPDRPVIVLGDLNDTPDSVALSALTPWLEADDLTDAGIDAETAERFRLIDAARLAPQPVIPTPPVPTHRRRAFGAVLDHVLVSSAFFSWRKDARGEVSAHEVHDAHFVAGAPALTSDHAAVSVTIRPVSGRSRMA